MGSITNTAGVRLERIGRISGRHGVLYRVIDDDLDAFLETTRRQADGVPLPAFVEQESATS